ncbi:regulator of nonsense transcripts 3A [Exaiptasia diaphana]|uniref:Tyrosinase copper-binding domain-containing protein n=1 Tax=Exaiptasia diaphana TaxID=2652724 RepID=A0A913XD89_EXADI|nr:regulator of nonsense transcripts 3A [Exaiptasia diaphana]KXJ12975.1 hypothetical protein AC249_AIPGENE22051 [Exaiptasia diaphana]
MKYNDRQFNDFEIAVRDTLHDNMHCRIGGRGGTMCSLSSANAPEFLLHHGFTDKLWSDWQKKGWNYKNAYFKRVFSRMTDTGLRPDAVLDLNHQPGGVRVIYQDPTHSKYQEVHRYLQQLTLQELKDIPRHRFTITQSLEFKLFMVNSNEKKKALAQQKAFEPRNVLSSKTRLRSTDKELGLRVNDLRKAVKRKREIEEKRKRETEEKRKREIEEKRKKSIAH